ncbi:SpoIIE family protein phosphatase [Streptomyces sp. NPDC002573]|uniref:SpoIIE family protein phosphatase n=1 Tax=Streptomyces sp. NPDC002573 TaxID=3364651 RepID=UPI00369AAC57
MQHSLLLQGAVPSRCSLETAHRYLPACTNAGVGGDWFDILQLSGARVGLIVGDVTGQGIQAVARAGRLRTAMRTLAALDFTPEEVLAHIDARVRQATVREPAAGRESGSVGSTCLYAIYDPVTGQCCAASAGHPAPIVVRPGEAAGLLPVSVGPPLGLGGLPFDMTQTSLPDGSLLALYTNGLFRGLQQDPDSLMHVLHALNGPEQQRDNLCQAAVEAALGGQPPADDAILVLTRARSLGPGRVATWDLPAIPEVDARARRLASGQLTVWGLAEYAPLAELVISELVTNAIRYGRGPIRLRLIREHPLICEVSDASSTSPHMRQASSHDEGGRGLFMVAQLAEAWGTRYTPTGKIIWVELAGP